MMLIDAWIEGTMSLLQHRMADGALDRGKTRANVAEAAADPRDEADKCVYRLPQSRQLAVPGTAIARLIREAGGAHKIKGSRKSVKFIVPAAVVVTDDLCPLFLLDRKTPIVDFEVDSRTVVIPATKGRVLRHRARFNEWALRVSLRVNEKILDDKLVRQLLADGGEQIGIGDFRPERGGPFGTFGLVAWDRIEAGHPKVTPARSRNGMPEPLQA